MTVARKVMARVQKRFAAVDEVTIRLHIEALKDTLRAILGEAGIRVETFLES